MKIPELRIPNLNCIPDMIIENGIVRTYWSRFNFLLTAMDLLVINMSTLSNFCTISVTIWLSRIPCMLSLVLFWIVFKIFKVEPEKWTSLIVFVTYTGAIWMKVERCTVGVILEIWQKLDLYHWQIYGIEGTSGVDGICHCAKASERDLAVWQGNKGIAW